MAALKFGPLNKSVFTQQLELVAKCLLQPASPVQFKVTNGKGQKELHVRFGDVDINMNSLLKRANFSHLQMSESDSKKYLFQYGGAPYKNYWISAPETVAKLSTAEQIAINKYTSSSGNWGINHLLYGKVDNSMQYDISTRENVLNAIMVASGINKILPSSTNYCGASSCSFRGEGHTSDAEIQKRIGQIKKGEVSDSPAFLSTTTDENVCFAFSNKSMIVFDSVYGKDIAHYSYYAGEKEFLLTPGQLQWQKHEMKDGKHVFHAKIVAPLIEGKDDASTQDLLNLKKLVEWAQKNGIETDHFTPWLKSELEKKTGLKLDNQESRNDADKWHAESLFDNDNHYAESHTHGAAAQEQNGLSFDWMSETDFQHFLQNSDDDFLSALLSEMFKNPDFFRAESDEPLLLSQQEPAISINEVISLDDDAIVGLESLTISTQQDQPTSADVGAIEISTPPSVAPIISPLEQMPIAVAEVIV